MRVAVPRFVPAQRIAVVDTGPLLDVLGLNYSQELVEPKLGNFLPKLNSAGLDFVNNQPLRESYLRFFSGIRGLLTTAHVVGELQGLVKSRLEIKDQTEDHRFFWTGSIAYLRRRGVEECLIRLLELQEDAVGRFGPIDTSVIRLAYSNGCGVLTHDSALISLADQQGVPCHLMRDVVWELYGSA